MAAKGGGEWNSVQSSASGGNLELLGYACVEEKVGVVHDYMCARCETAFDEGISALGRAGDDGLRMIAFSGVNHHPPFALLEDERAGGNGDKILPRQIERDGARLAVEPGSSRMRGTE